MMMINGQHKILVLDDDPMGSQTVHGCLILMNWDVETLKQALCHHSPLLFIITNTRSLTQHQAAKTIREICQSLKLAIEAVGIQKYLIISRSDSTLRGHYPLETNIVTEEFGVFDAQFLVPAFMEGGRITRNSTHYIRKSGVDIPVHQTEFACDSVFGYRHSYLPNYIEEKTQGQVQADSVERFLLSDIDQGSQERLLNLKNNQYAVVDAQTQADLNRFAKDVLDAVAQGKRFLFSSAAGLVAALANLPPQSIASDKMALYLKENKKGAIIIGSHIKKTTEQLEHLLQEPSTIAVPVDANRLLSDSPDARIILLAQVLESVHKAYSSGKTPVIYTSREELTFDSAEVRLRFGAAVSALLVEIVKGLPSDLGFLITKGGITSSDILRLGFSVKTIQLLGQIQPGCSMVQLPNNHYKFPNLSVVLCPGNVGDVDTLALIYRKLNCSLLIA
jgi:uncharacterized protein YgbK (DUF1537 family)